MTIIHLVRFQNIFFYWLVPSLKGPTIFDPTGYLDFTHTEIVLLRASTGSHVIFVCAEVRLCALQTMWSKLHSLKYELSK